MYKTIYYFATLVFLLIFTNSCTEKKNITTVSNNVSNTVTKIDDSITDIDGNVYHTLKIGALTWMVENLKTTKYSDGTDIPIVADSSTWSNLTSPGYCIFNNDASNKNTYGALYNWYAINTGKLAPSGWHVSTDEEWKMLENYLISNGYNYDGSYNENKIAKSLAAKTGWQTFTDYIGAVSVDLTKNNTSGFTGLPVGCRNYDGSFSGNGIAAGWWSTTVYNPDVAWFRILSTNNSNLVRLKGNKGFGFSVRCVMD